MANERLRGCIAEVGLSIAQVAEHVGVDPKTVERWISTGRLPHRSHRSCVAALLRIDEVYLWSQTLGEKRSADVSRSEVVALYPARGAVPKDVWLGLLEGARARIDILTYSSLFLPDSYPDFGDRLAVRVDAGASARLLFGDPESDAVRLRGQEERIGDGMASRVRLSLSYLREAQCHPKIEFRLHGTTLYNSIYRFDEDMLVNAHAYGTPASRSIVLHLRSLGGESVFKHYEESFERVWSQAVPPRDDG